MVMAHTVMAHIGITRIDMDHIVMAHIVKEDPGHLTRSVSDVWGLCWAGS